MNPRGEKRIKIIYYFKTLVYFKSVEKVEPEESKSEKMLKK